MRLSEFDYYLPPESIAQQPLPDRASSRMLVIDRARQTWEDRQFRDLPQFLRPGDCLVLNDSKVFPARLYGQRESGTGGQVEVLLVRAMSPDHLIWLALARPGRKMRSGEHIRFSDDLSADIVGRSEFGERILRFHCDGDIFEALERVGHVPLPPYIHRPDRPEDRERYQTVYARQPGSVAAPTAGLHFTPETLAACQAAGAEIARVTLHVGLGTFQPLRTEVVESGKLHAEAWSVEEQDATKLRRAARIVAVGTTSVRVLETLARSDWVSRQGDTDLFIYSGFDFRATGAMLTNFHLPKSSLLLLVCAFGGKDLVLAAYRHAVEAGYRFYSYGDCMLIG
jgi:S-adenosylmethionine:tRNA ribosyltransferase-isomerase